MKHISYTHSSVVEHLGCFQVLSITNKAAMNKVEYVPLLHGEASFGYIPKAGIAMFLGRSISTKIRLPPFVR